MCWLPGLDGRVVGMRVVRPELSIFLGVGPPAILILSSFLGDIELSDECSHLLFDVSGTFGFISIYPTFTK